MTSADNIALETALFAPVTTIRSLAVLRIVDAEETNDYVARLEGAYYVDSTYVGDNDAIITFQVGSTAASTDGVTITLPRDGGTITESQAGTTNDATGLIQWPSEDAAWKHFAINITLDGASDWDMRIDPVGTPDVTGRTSPLILRGLSLRRTA